MKAYTRATSEIPYFEVTRVHNVNNFAALTGIDWADNKHDICEHPTHTYQS